MTMTYTNNRPQRTNDQGLRTTSLLVTLILCITPTVRAADACYWKAKAASALAIRSVISSAEVVKPPVPPPGAPPPPSAAKVEARPVVVMYSAAWCAPCQRAKTELKAREKSLPFVIKLVDVDKTGWPASVDSIPHFEWDSPRGKLFAKWNGVEDLVARWELSQK